MLSHPQAIKALMPGRIVVIDNSKHKNAVAFILKASSSSSKEKTFTVLVICEQKQEWPELEPANTGHNKDTVGSAEMENSNCMLPRPVIVNQLFRPEGACGHEVITVTGEDIYSITTKSSRINADKILDDYKKRQIPRFK